MKIAFYAPLKSPDHPVVSGDREMARLLIRAFEAGGHEVEIASRMRAYLPTPDESSLRALVADSAIERARIAGEWHRRVHPDLWFTYHPYYKSPDLLGPSLASDFSIPYVTAEASLSGRRSTGAWADTQARVTQAVRQAAVNLCFTRRDHDGLKAFDPAAALAMLPPFIDAAPFPETRGTSKQLITVAMMRPGNKLDSYAMLARALRHMERSDWTLAIIGDGAARNEVRQLFEGFSDCRIIWRGQLEREAITAVLADSAIYVWPGCGEAFGLSYLEAQAAGLPVVAQATAGVPEVVRHDETGLLTPEGDVPAFAGAIERLLADAAYRHRLGRQARRFVHEERSLEAAARRLGTLLPQWAVA